MKTKILKSILSLTLALALVVGGGIRLGNFREVQPRCDYDSVREIH